MVGDIEIVLRALGVLPHRVARGKLAARPWIARVVMGGRYVLLTISISIWTCEIEAL